MNDPIENIINEMASDKIMSEIISAYEGLTDAERDEILSTFGRIMDEHGEQPSAEMMKFFHDVSMRLSKTYYFLKVHLAKKDEWDTALNELNQ